MRTALRRTGCPIPEREAHTHSYESSHVTITLAITPCHQVHSHDVRMIGVYFDDCTLVIDNPQHVTVVDGMWLLGGWTTVAGIILRPVVRGHNEPPQFLGLTIRGNYIDAAASFKPEDYVGGTFVLLDHDVDKGA